MGVNIVDGGNSGLCGAWQLGMQSHQVQLFEREKIMCAPSRASLKLLHASLSFLKRQEFRLVREALPDAMPFVVP